MVQKEGVAVTPENVNRVFGKQAHQQNILAARILSEVVKSTLGPKGMDKMLVDPQGNITITNDGVTILSQMQIDHPAAKLLVDIAKTQEKEVGDGTTTVAVLTGALLNNAQKLLDKKIHPTVISRGYTLARNECMKILDEVAISAGTDKERLMNVAQTAMTGKAAETHRTQLADIIIQAVDIVREGNDVDQSRIKFSGIKSDGIEHTEIVRGLILDKEVPIDSMPRNVKNPKIALLDFDLEIKMPERDTEVSINSPEQLTSFMKAERQTLDEIKEAIVKSGANVVFCQKNISEPLLYGLSKAGIMAIRRVNKFDMEDLAKATGASIVSSKEDIETSLGYAGEVAAIHKGEDMRIFVRDCPHAKVTTIFVHGASKHGIEEIRRALTDGLGDVCAVIKSGSIVAGGGAIEIEIAKRLREFARTVAGREQLAVEEFANAIEYIPETLAENAGMDSIMTITELRKRHEQGELYVGLNLFTNTFDDTLAAGIIEPTKVKYQAITSANEVANIILRIDDNLISREKQ